MIVASNEAGQQQGLSGYGYKAGRPPSTILPKSLLNGQKPSLLLLM